MITEEEKEEIIRSQQGIIEDQQKIIDEMKDALREIGNGDSELGYQGLGYDWRSGDDFWVFERMDYAR